MGILYFPGAPFSPEEILEPANQMGGGGILIGTSYPNPMCKRLHPRVSALQDCSGVEMPLSPLVSAEVPAVSVVVQDLLSGLAQPFPPDYTSEPK